MFQPFYVAATGLSSIQDEILDITNNLSNAKTVAFKKGRTDMESLFYIEKSFKDYLYEAMSGTNVPPVTVEYGTGVRVAGTPKDFTQGSIDSTGNAMDCAISGEGFFQVKMPDGTLAYTRAGNFHIDNDGNIVDPNGRMIDPSIVVPKDATAVVISQNGTVAVSVNNSSSLTELGQITLSRFTNPSGLKSLGQNLFQASEASGDAVIGIANADGFGQINQYSLEQSNVDVISEMMRMVMAQKVFDTVSSAVKSYQGMLTSLERMNQA